jgi:spermidine/putrescine transport system ATP-binding protein
VTAAVEIAGVSKTFGEFAALEQINLQVRDNEFVSLLGASGCGKSTLLRIVAGFEQSSRGRVFIHGEDVTSLPPHLRPTNLVFQRGALFPHMNVFDNIGYSLKLRGWPKPRIAGRVAEMLALVRLEGLDRRNAAELSGGQIQRVALARALAAEPKVLLLDEPLSALDLKLRQQMQLELRAIQRSLGATFIFVTHDQTEALVMSDRIAIMNQGRIVQFGTPREIYTRPSSMYVSDFIGQTNFLKGIVVSSANGVTTLDVGNGEQATGESASVLATGVAGILSVRPESIRIGSAERRAYNSALISARVIEIVYLGSSVRVGSVTPANTTIWAELRDADARDLTIGVEVKLSWSPTAATIWAGGGARN